MYISAVVARPRFPSWSSSTHCLTIFSLYQDSIPVSPLHLSLLPCPYLLSLSYLSLPLSLIRRRSVRTLSLQGDQLPLSIVSESYDLVLSGLVSTSQLSHPVATHIHPPKSGKRFSDHYIHPQKLGVCCDALHPLYQFQRSWHAYDVPLPSSPCCPPVQ